MGLATWPPRPASTRVKAGSPLALTQSRPEVPPRYRFQWAGSCCELVSSAVASLRTAMSLAGPSARRRGGAPVTGMTWAQVANAAGCPAALTARISPSAFQPVTRVRRSPHQVRRR